MRLPSQVRRSRLSLISLALVALAGCGGSGGDGPSSPNTPTPPSTPGTPANPVQNATVIMTSGDDGYGVANKFNPDAVVLVRGGTVTWANDTGIIHNVTFSTAGSPANIGNHGSGSTSRTFPNAGTYNYQCTQHSGMSGQVTVQ